MAPKTHPNWGQVRSQEASSKQTGKISKICTAPQRELHFQWFRGPYLAPKFIKNRFQNPSETDRPLGWVLNGSWDGFWTIFGATWGPRWAPTWHQNSLKIHLKTDRKRIVHCAWLLGRILDDFWCQLGAKMGAKTMQNEVPEPLEKVSENLWNKGKVNDDLREILVESLHIKLIYAAHKARRTVFFRTHSFRYSGSRALGACV